MDRYCYCKSVFVFVVNARWESHEPRLGAFAQCGFIVFSMCCGCGLHMFFKVFSMC